MARCDTCGNEYDKSLEIAMAGRSYNFDSFECAIHLLAPKCTDCGCTVVGHGVEANGELYCCAHCANESGIHNVADRSEDVAPS